MQSLNLKYEIQNTLFQYLKESLILRIIQICYIIT